MMQGNKDPFIKTRLRRKKTLPGVHAKPGRLRKDGTRGPTQYIHRETGTPLSIKDEEGKHVRWLDPENKDDLAIMSDIISAATGKVVTISPGSLREGTLGWLFDMWLDDAENRQLKDGTPKASSTIYRNKIVWMNMPSAWLRNQIAHFSVREFYQYRTNMIAAGQAHRFNKEFTMLRLVFSWAERQHYMPPNPVSRHYPAGLLAALTHVPKAPHKVKHHEPWPMRMLEVWLTSAQPHMADLVRFLAATSLRISDAIRVTRDQLEGGSITITQQKTRKPVTIPVSAIPYIRDGLAAMSDMGPGTVLKTVRGSPWTLPNLSNQFCNERRRIAEVYPDLPWMDHSLHDLRCNAVVALLESGVDEFHVRAISGHSTVELVRQYGREYLTEMAAQQAALMATKEPRLGHVFR